MRMYFILGQFSGANVWIYKGYESAWNSLGFEVSYINNLKEIDTEDYSLMVTDWAFATFNPEHLLEAMSRSKHAYMFAQPHSFPEPWGAHPNFKSCCDDKTVEALNNMENVKLWSFLDIEDDYYSKWKKIHSIPLAYDSINYKEVEDKTYEFDVCFIGGIADNGFNEKHQIMLDHFDPLRKSDLKCGLFINKNLTHEEETKILYNSKVSINIHDAYQRTLGLDTNERTFKSLGLNGCLVSDSIKNVSRLFPELKTASTPGEMLELVKEYTSMDKDKLQQIKQRYKNLIQEKHTYVERVKEMLDES